MACVVKVMACVAKVRVGVVKNMVCLVKVITFAAKSMCQWQNYCVLSQGLISDSALIFTSHFTPFTANIGCWGCCCR